VSTSPRELAKWFQEGVKQKATHMIVVCDTFDYSDYPVYVTAGQDAREIVKERNQNEMQKVMEVYNLKMSMNEQVKGGSRVFNY
jgi:hypothetical protein